MEHLMGIPAQYNVPAQPSANNASVRNIWKSVLPFYHVRSQGTNPSHQAWCRAP